MLREFLRRFKNTDPKFALPPVDPNEIDPGMSTGSKTVTGEAHLTASLEEIRERALEARRRRGEA